MTWEYLIGSEKDFEGAPDWCTHASEYFWVMNSVIKLGDKFKARGGVEVHHYDESFSSGVKIEVIAQRRKREQKQWDGVGIPPVGCECEALIPYLDEMQRQWRKVRVICSGDEFGAADELIVVDVENTHPLWADEFRLIRTKEQIERDEAVKSMVDFLVYAEFMSWEDMAERMLDAGYRKTK